MADHPRPVKMQGQGNGAVGAADHEAALAAEDKAGKASPVQKEQRLLAALQHLVQAREKRPAEDVAMPLAQLFAHVHYVHRRQIHGGYPGAHFKQAGAAPFRLAVAFQRRGGAAQKEKGAVVARSPPGHLPGMIARRFLLFVACLLYTSRCV